MSDYRYWLAGLRLTDGKRQLTRDEMQSLGISEDNIGSGFFRKRTGPREPFASLVAIWEQEGETLAIADGAYVPAQDVWLSACKYPIHEVEYRVATNAVTSEELAQLMEEFP
jgi:hypothetical protein